MASIKPVLIICDEPVIHKPKPKRINKIQNNMPHINIGHFSHRQLNQNQNKMNRRHNHEKKRKNNNKGKEKMSFNLDLISLEEIENDFNEFKSKNEEIEVQKELLNLLRNANNNYKNENYCNNFRNLKRPKNPDYKNYELVI